MCGHVEGGRRRSWQVWVIQGFAMDGPVLVSMGADGVLRLGVGRLV